MFKPRSRRRSAGFTLIEILAVTGIMSGLQGQSQGNWRYGISKANEIKGLHNLKQIHLLIQMQAMTGRLPSAAFYPQGDPKKDPKSIVRLVQGAPPELFISPFAPPALQQKGLTFAWNDKVNGKGLDSVSREWLLVDLAAFIADPKIPKPKKYLILYGDGRAIASTTLPPGIAKAVKEAETKKK
ncbi:hypothetical protein HQ560_08725 [bacterium]|nr:hypothetical protein [bacterium]